MTTWLVRAWNRVVFRWRRSRLEEELAEEMEFHRSLKRSESGGGQPMGNVTLAREDCREAWGFAGLERLWLDLRFAGRLIRRAPGFTAIAVLSLAIGIGGN